MISEELKKEIKSLDAEDLKEVINEATNAIKLLKDSESLQSKKLSNTANNALNHKKNSDIISNEKYNVFDDIADSSIDTGINDWARNHDHYLYGVDKK